MSDLTPERRAELRRDAEHHKLLRFVIGTASDGYPMAGYESVSEDVLALLDAADERDRLAAAVERVQALHVGSWGCGNPSHTNPDVGCPDCFMECDDCGEAHPCPTLRALDGTDGPQ